MGDTSLDSKKLLAALFCLAISVVLFLVQMRAPQTEVLWAEGLATTISGALIMLITGRNPNTRTTDQNGNGKGVIQDVPKV